MFVTYIKTVEEQVLKSFSQERRWDSKDLRMLESLSSANFVGYSEKCGRAAPHFMSSLMSAMSAYGGGG